MMAPGRRRDEGGSGGVIPVLQDGRPQLRISMNELAAL
jgi:hypothetical protein